MFQQRQRRTIQAPVSKASSSASGRGGGRAAGGGGGAGGFTAVHAAVLFLGLAASAALALYLVAVSSLYDSSSEPSSSASSSRHAERREEERAGPLSSSGSEQKDAAAAAAGAGEAAVVPDASSSTSRGKAETLVLKTEIGSLRIALRPDLSPGSAEYIRRVLARAGQQGECPGCRLYRAEKPGILQGILRKDVEKNLVKGECPPGSEAVANDCPEWDKQCGCHGPVMTRGMVGWAAGTSGGPDFFINNYRKPADFWGTQHTGA
jgi:hypothetical protein